MVEAPRRRKEPDSSGRPASLSGVTRSPRRRRGAMVDNAGALKALPVTEASGKEVPVGERPMAAPETGVAAAVAVPPGVTTFPTGTGIARMLDSSAR